MFYNDNFSYIIILAIEKLKKDLPQKNISAVKHCTIRINELIDRKLTDNIYIVY